MARKPIRERMKIDTLLFRNNVVCGVCGDMLYPGQPIEWDHIHALAHGGDHTYLNLRPLHPECHKPKTARDIRDNAKVKRLANPKPSRHPMVSSGRKIPSRPFPKRVAT